MWKDHSSLDDELLVGADSSSYKKRQLSVIDLMSRYSGDFSCLMNDQDKRQGELIRGRYFGLLYSG